MPDAIARAAQLIKNFEGCKLTAYPDPASGGDPWTIGWGSTGPGIKRGVEWTQSQADGRLTHDVEDFARLVDKALDGKPATDGQCAALISFAYNLGIANLRSSTLLRLHRVGDYAGAALQFGRWNKAGGAVMRGLTRRREAERLEYIS